MISHHRARNYIAAAVLAALVAAAPGRATAQGALPDVGIVLVVEVRDTAGWIPLHDQVLRTATQASKPLVVSVTPSGPRRSITVTEPRFTVSVLKGTRAVAVTVAGKITGGEAVAGLGAFEHAVLTTQAIGDTELELGYGLASVTSYLVEMHFTRE